MSYEELTTCYNTIAFPLYVKARCVGSSCNLNCDFCPQKEEQQSEQNHTITRMSDEILEAFTLKYIQAQIHTPVHFEWEGGEPLLAGIPFFVKALKLQEQSQNKRAIYNTVITNGTLLNDEWCLFLKKHQFRVIVKLDGPANLHDRYRVKKDHIGSFSESLIGIKLLMKYGIPFHVQVLVHDYNVNYPLELYNFFKNNKITKLTLVPNVQRFDSPSHNTSVTARDWGNFLCAIFDEWVRKDVGLMHIQIFDQTLQVFAHEDSQNCIYQGSCGHTATLDHDGKLYTCRNFYQPEHYLGDIKEESITGLMYGRKQLRFAQAKRAGLSVQCKRCPYQRLCHGGCINHRYGISTTGERNQNILCQGYQHFFSHVSPAMVFMAEEMQYGRSASRIMSFFQSTANP